MIVEMVSNGSFTLSTGNSKRSRLRYLKNGVPQGSVLAPLLFNIYISDLPTTVSRKYAYADDLAIMHADATNLRIATLALVYLTAEYCALVWCRSAQSYPPNRPRHQRRFANCDWMPASYTSGQPSNPCRHATC